MRNDALAIIAIGPRSNAITKTMARPPVMNSPSTWRFQIACVNVFGSCPSRAIWYETLDAPNRVALTADEVDSRAAMAMSLKPNWPRNGSAASASV